MKLIFTLLASTITASVFAFNTGVSNQCCLNRIVERTPFYGYPDSTPLPTNFFNSGTAVNKAGLHKKIPANLPTAFLKWALKNNQYSIGKTYMWKSAFEATVNDTLLSQLNKYGIDTLLLSPGTNHTKIPDFLTKAQNQNIHVSRLLSENSYAKDANGIQKLILKLQTLQYDFPGLHLNIEPHTFADYKNNIPFYTQRMDSIYATAKQWCDPRNIKLSVSIPMHLPLQNAAYLASNGITPWIMAYENPDQQKLLQRTQSLRSTLGNNYVWVIRVIDFNTQQEIVDAVAYLHANGVSRVALYDFSTIPNLF